MMLSSLLLMRLNCYYFLQRGKIRCSCEKCNCRNFLCPAKVRKHLYKRGFKLNYFIWSCHEEELTKQNLAMNPTLYLRIIIFATLMHNQTLLR